MLERTIITILLIFAAAVIWKLQTLYSKSIVKRTNASALFQAGNPGILYFWSEGCAVCKTVQKPAIESLISENLVKNLQFVAVNISEQPELTSEWGVLTVPSSFIINKEGICKYINSGVVSKEYLTKQLLTL